MITTSCENRGCDGPTQIEKLYDRLLTTRDREWNAGALRTATVLDEVLDFARQLTTAQEENET